MTSCELCNTSRGVYNIVKLELGYDEEGETKGKEDQI